ncbi:MAG: response regulator transcription factor [Chloroflexota bacterium]|nr:response regulator transcription factor [Chloroflexota bacterium]
MGLFFYNRATGRGTADLFRDGKLREGWSADDFKDFGQGWTLIASTLDNLLFYDPVKGTARLAGIAHLGRLDVFPGKETLKGFSPGWTAITQVSPHELIFYGKESGNAVIGRLASGDFRTISPKIQLKHGWSHIQSFPGYLFFYDTQQGLAAMTPYQEASSFRQGLGDVFEIDPGYSHMVAVWQPTAGTPAWKHWLLAYDSKTGNGAVFEFKNGSLVKTQDLAGAFSSGWDSIAASDGHLFYYRRDGIGAAGRIDTCRPAPAAISSREPIRRISCAQSTRCTVVRPSSGPSSPSGWRSTCSALSHPTVTPPFPELTDREREILDLIARGQSNVEIADYLVVSLKTVRNHVSNILNKLEVVDRAQAMDVARRKGLGPGRR